MKYLADLCSCRVVAVVLLRGERGCNQGGVGSHAPPARGGCVNYSPASGGFGWRRQGSRSRSGNLPSNFEDQSHVDASKKHKMPG